MNVLLLTSHAIAEHDDLGMFTRMGVPVYSIGGAYDEVPFEGKRPAIPGVIRYPDLEAATAERRARLGAERGDPGPAIDWGKASLAPEVIDWADTIIVHHFPEHWIGGQWQRIRDKRVIWRTCGQSDPRLERAMMPFRDDGMQIVRYSPMETVAFTGWNAYAGADATIRFGKDPLEWTGWRGDWPVVGNITQDMLRRGDACGYAYWQEVTAGFPARPAGPGSELMPGGGGSLSYEEMRFGYLRSVRVYLYTGTRPASYTLGLIEAMMTGTPTVAMGPRHFGHSAPLYEAHHLALGRYALRGKVLDTDDVADARELVRLLLTDTGFAAEISAYQRTTAIAQFGLAGVMDRWAKFLGLPPVTTLGRKGIADAQVYPAARP